MKRALFFLLALSLLLLPACKATEPEQTTADTTATADSESFTGRTARTDGLGQPYPLTDILDFTLLGSMESAILNLQSGDPGYYLTPDLIATLAEQLRGCTVVPKPEDGADDSADRIIYFQFKKDGGFVKRFAMNVIIRGSEVCLSVQSELLKPEWVVDPDVRFFFADPAEGEAFVQAIDRIGQDLGFESTPVVGGWSADAAIPGTLPSNVYSAFEEVMATWDGEKPEALACIGEQYVSGSNYAVLCKLDDHLTILYVYDPLDGKASVTARADFTVADFVGISEAESREEMLDGGWTTPVYGSVTQTGPAMEAYDKAMETLVGAAYEPLACIGSQTTAGTCYAYVCRGSMVVAPGSEAQSGMYLITVYADPAGNAAVETITLFRAEELIPEA